MRTITLSIAIIFLSITGFSQSTTQVEYTFMTKGFKRVVEEGADMKAGYSQNKFYDQKFGNYSFQAVKILRSDLSLAGTVIAMDDAGFLGGRTYICIPNMEPGTTAYGFQDYYTKVSLLTEGQSKAFLKFLAVLYSQQ